jgi:phosphoglycerate dehydrogenase-like enzyme
LIIRAGSGVDNIDLDAVNELNLPLVRIPQPGAKAVAELTFALMLALSRDLIRADISTKGGEWLKHQLTGYLLTGKVLGIVGVGNIGSRVGYLGSSWGMDVIGFDIIDTQDFRDKVLRKGVTLVEFEEVLSRADYLCLHVPLYEETKNLIDVEELSIMKPGSYLINIARGGIVNEQALYQELTAENRLRGAGLDVHELEGEGKISPLADLPNVILTPHIGAMTIDSQKEIGSRILSAVNEFGNPSQPDKIPAGLL